MARNTRESSPLIWWIVGALCIFTLGIAGYFWWADPAKTPSTETKMVSSSAKKQNNPSATKVSETANLQPASTATLVDASLLDQAIPQNETLAKDEIAKLEDIQKQLNEQTATLKSQHQDADQIIKLKEEQIKLLEVQMTQQNKNSS